jgi:nucleoside-diphosphate-sugar epimerase
MTKVFISGITGFVGQPLSKLLVQQGVTVTGLARNPIELDGCTVLPGNVLDPASYADEARNAELVVHLAAPTVASYIASHPHETMTCNVTGVLNMLNCFESGPGKHFVLVSTGKVYGRSQVLPYKEEHALNPIGALGRSKQIAEQLVKFFSEHSSKRFSIMRLFNGYGPGQNGDFLVPTIISQIKNGTISLGDTAGRRDFIFVDDIVSGIMSVLNSQAPEEKFEVFNLGTGRSYSPADLVGFLEKITGTSLPIVTDASKLRSGEPDEERCDNSRLTALGWRNSTDISAGLERTLRAFAHVPSRQA